MLDKNLLKQLIDQLDVFERERAGAIDLSLADFGFFLLDRASAPDQAVAQDAILDPGSRADARVSGSPGQEIHSDALPGPMARLRGPEEAWMGQRYGHPVHEIPVLVALMYRYARHYVKKALKASPLQTMEEFGFLVSLLTHASMTKTELIQAGVMEKTTGTEVIRRLAKLELVREFPDADDKRSIRVALTDSGRAVILALLPRMESVAHIVAGNLTPAEIAQLYRLLKKLDAHHNDLYLYRRNQSLEDLQG